LPVLDDYCLTLAWIARRTGPLCFEISGHALEARGEIQQINLGYLEIGIPAPSA
jgi:hypothetical protein